MMIPDHLEPVEAITWMTEHHYTNRHPEVGEPLGLLFTYYELIVEQNIRSRNHEEKTEHGVSKSRSGSGTQKKVEAVDGRNGNHSKSSRQRDSMAIHEHANGQDPASQDTRKNDAKAVEPSDAESIDGRRGGDASERPPKPDAPLREKLDWWRPRI